MRNAPLARGLVVAALVVDVVAACSFDTSGNTSSATFAMSLGEAGSDPDATDQGSAAEDDATEGSEGASVDGSGTTGSPECGGAICGAMPPAGWLGPFAIAVSSPPAVQPACAPGWSEHVYAWRELHADPATCGCTCNPTGGACTITASYYSNSGCTTGTANADNSGECDSMYTQSGHGYVRMMGSASGIGCAPAPTKVVPTATWTSGALLCAPPPGDACDGGSCLPATPPGFDARWCITAEGQQPCANPAYPQPLLVHRNFVDTRDCTPCSCNLPGQPSCPGTVDEYYDAICLIDGPNIAVDGACHASGVGGVDGWGLSYDGAPPTYACSGTASIANGGAMATEPMTICCTE